jgi:Family of unknown function (DUF6049)
VTECRSPDKQRHRVCRPTALTTLLAVSLIAVSPIAASLLPPPVPAAAAPAVANGRTTLTSAEPVPTPPSPLAVSVTKVTPTVAVPRKPVVITGSVRNSGTVSITSPVARALVGQRPLTSRQSVSEWATPTRGQPLRQVARIPLGKVLAPGAVSGFTLTVLPGSVSHGESFAVLPLQVEVVGTAARSTQVFAEVHTFLPTLATIKAFEPMSIAWVVPLTLDPDPALHGTPSPARTAAWNRAIGPGSRLERLIQGTENANVTWAIDPAILGPRETPPADATAAQPQPTQSPSEPARPTPQSPATPDPVTAATAALAERLKAAAPRHTLWSLPYADPDLSALLPLTSGNQLTTMISHPSTLDVAVGQARADIAWPVGGALPAASQTRLRRAFGPTGLAAAVTSASSLTGQNGASPDASLKSATGLPLLAYDESLSRTFAQTSSGANGALTIQRFLADSMALLGERPGTPDRSVLVAEPRTFAGDPAVVQSLLAEVANAPWLSPATTGQLLAASQKLTPEIADNGSTGAGRTSPSASPPLTATQPPTDPLDPGVSPLTTGQLATIPGKLAGIAGIASILGDGRQFAVDWGEAQVQRLSTRWRGHPEGLDSIDAATSAAISTVSRSVRVAPSSVNFFADRGVMQVTVVNDLDVPIRDVHLTMTPDRQRLRIEQQPGPLRIGAKSRVNVPLQVTTIAAGVVGVEAVLTTRNGTPLGQNASVNVRVQPPGTWVYWVLGGLAGIVLVFGTQRSLRRGSTRASRPDAQELPLND